MIEGRALIPASWIYSKAKREEIRILNGKKKKEDKSNSTYSNDEGSRGGSSGTEVKTRVVGGNEKSGDEYTEDVEEENSNVNLKCSIERVRFADLERVQGA